MRILQLIDTLEAGGAERMAVNLANSLADVSENSFLCATRGEGILKKSISPTVNYLFLNKKQSLDIVALFRLKRYVKFNNIEILHAHGTSFFFATMLKFIYPKLKLVWHDHYGNRIYNSISKNKTLYICSIFFDCILCVNKQIADWSMNNLKSPKVIYLSNFICKKSKKNFSEKKKIIVCVANLRKPKDHLNLLEAFKMVNNDYPEWQLKLIGRNFEDIYSYTLKKFIIKNNLEKAVEICGASNSVDLYLKDASIGVLSSEIEGLPVSLLEYGNFNLAVVTTDVGECRDVVQNFGKVVPSKNPKALAHAISEYINDESIRMSDAMEFKEHILKNYSAGAIIPKLLKIYKNL